MKLSTGLRNYMLSGGSLKAALASGKLIIYSGAIPATADDAIGSATPLWTVSGVSFDTAAANATLLKESGAWTATASAGTGTFFRHTTSADAGAADATAYRIQGTFGVAGCDLNRAAGATLTAASVTLDYYAVVFPTL